MRQPTIACAAMKTMRLGRIVAPLVPATIAASIGPEQQRGRQVHDLQHGGEYRGNDDESQPLA